MLRFGFTVRLGVPDRRFRRFCRCVCVIAACLIAVGGETRGKEPQLRLVRRKADPYGSPRPAPSAEHVPVDTSFWFQIELVDGEAGDAILADSVTFELSGPDGFRRKLLGPNQEFAAGARGWLRPDPRQAGTWMAYVDFREPLRPDSRYTASVTAKSKTGVVSSPRGMSWRFTTESARVDAVASLKLDFRQPATRWDGSFFAGICNVVFCTDQRSFGPLHAQMAAAHAEHPRAWRLRRDIWLTAGDEWKPDWATLMDPRWPNIVHERETRRVTKIEHQPEGLLLHVTAKFGCEQYGVDPQRSLGDDYRAGMTVLLADGHQDATATVKAVDDDGHTVLVQLADEPESEWRLEYKVPPPRVESSDAPGRFAAGGMYLRRFDPPGTPVYYWARLDKEYDLVHQHGQRIVVNFVEASPDLSLTGRPYTRPKDYAQWHRVVRTITGHLIDRYGDDASEFYWSVFNEPDIVGDYWRFHWDEAQRFYDYTTDAVLRAFEDRGYDSSGVRVGGWELGAIFGTHLRLKEILAHCSPSARADGTLEKNAVFADARLSGQRSQRVERLCRAHDGHGSPCDFLSIHTYNRSDMAAAKLIRAKEMALEADAGYYRNLAIHTHESCPGWNPPPDPAAGDSYLGNGYFPSWCFDVAARLLDQARQDGRFGRGESVITIWPPPQGWSGVNTLLRHLAVDEDGDQKADQRIAVPNPIFHALTLLSDFRDEFWVDAGTSLNGNALSAIASRPDPDKILLAVVAHQPADIQSRSQAKVAVQLEMQGVPARSQWQVSEYRFDRQHNSCFPLIKELQQQRESVERERVEKIIRVFEEGSDEDLDAAISQLSALSAAELSLVGPSVLRRLPKIKSRETRELLESTVKELTRTQAGLAQIIPGRVAQQIERRAKLSVTSTETIVASTAGRVRLEIETLPNSVSVFVLNRGAKREP